MVATLFRVPATLVRVVATLFRVAAKLLGVALTLLGVAATLLGVAPAGSALANGAVSCSLAATPLAFGQYVPFSNLPDDFTATITVTCTSTGAATVPLQGSMSLIGAMGSSGRQLSNGRATLRYHTYLNPARTMYWVMDPAAAAPRRSPGSSVPAFHSANPTPCTGAFLLGNPPCGLARMPTRSPSC